MLSGPDMSAEQKILLGFAPQENGGGLQRKMIANDCENLVQHLVQVHAGKDSLTGVIHEGDLSSGLEQRIHVSVGNGPNHAPGLKNRRAYSRRGKKLLNLAPYC